MAKLYDVAILGATPGGWAAAYALAKAGLEPIVIDAPSAGCESTLCDWVPKDFFHAPLPKTLARSANAVEFQRVVYHAGDLDRQAEFQTNAPAGYLLRSCDLLAAMKDAATKAGAKSRTTREAVRILASEDSVRIEGTTPVTAQVLLVVHNRPYDILGDLGLPVRTVPRSPCIIAGIDIPCKASPAARKLGKALHVIASREPSELGLLFLVDGTLHLRVVSMSAAAGNRAAELSAMVSELRDADILPPDLPLHQAHGAVWTPPAGIALDLETHVAKRCILAGTAGGFVDTITGHTLAPTVQSALIAADVAIEALKSESPQDALMAFKDRWRDKLADYLRPPSTSLQLLLPLLFANERLVTRFTNALLYGESL